MYRLRHFGLAMGLLLLTAPPARAFTWSSVCGGGTFSVCASVELAVGAAGDLVVRVQNLSGIIGGSNNAIITLIAFTNLPSRGVDYVYGLNSISGPSFQLDSTDPFTWWEQALGTESASSLQLTPASGFTDAGIVSSCFDFTNPGVSPLGYWVTPNPACTPNGTIDNPDLNGGWFEMSFSDFNLQEAWDPSTAGLVIHAMSADGLDSAELTVAPVPEPVSMLLLGSGLAGLGGLRLRRRRHEAEE